MSLPARDAGDEGALGKQAWGKVEVGQGVTCRVRNTRQVCGVSALLVWMYGLHQLAVCSCVYCACCCRAANLPEFFDDRRIVIGPACTVFVVHRFQGLIAQQAKVVPDIHIKIKLLKTNDVQRWTDSPPTP
ncbi:MAG: hypothetical protein M0Z99_34215 [Betaproteobacteria bacterium]|nr:hypothetical protein [Betaproteobacteria bacterium]